jgi:hypothetical protein
LAKILGLPMGRLMKVQGLLLNGMAAKAGWWAAAESIGSVTDMRRWRARLRRMATPGLAESSTGVFM